MAPLSRSRRAPYRAIVVTGASSGLGASLARAYAAPGVALGLIGRDRTRLNDVVSDCTASGARVQSASVDIADREAVGSWLSAFDEVHPIDLLVANAGISAGPDPGGVGEPIELTTRQIEINLLGAVNTIAPVVPSLVARGRGRIVAVASTAAYRGLPYSPGYCASKAGLRAYVEALRAQLEPRGVGVTVVCPGFFGSRMTDRWEGPTPFLFTGERAAAIVKRGIDRGHRRIDFPLALTFGMRFCDLAPAVLGDAILRRFHFHIRAPS